jgi:electron transfer flavoprotein beta subunit
VDIVVLAKYVPNPAGDPPEIGPDFRLRREAAGGALDPSDAPAVARAVELAREHDGTVTALSLGPERAQQALREALALGADSAVLVNDTRLAGADALVTATALAAAIERRRFDLVLAGAESSDGATGTMPATLAELLGLPCATFARSLRVEAGRAIVERQTDLGHDEIECRLPLLVAVTAAVAEPRRPSLKETMAAKRAPVELVGVADLGLDEDSLAIGQAVTSVAIAPARKAAEIVDEIDAPARIAELLAELR